MKAVHILKTNINFRIAENRKLSILSLDFVCRLFSGLYSVGIIIFSENVNPWPGLACSMQYLERKLRAIIKKLSYYTYKQVLTIEPKLK